jgi:hypothetical protein
MKILGTLALAQVVAAAEKIDNPDPALMETFDAQLQAGELTHQQYVIQQTALGLALLAWTYE